MTILDEIDRGDILDYEEEEEEESSSDGDSVSCSGEELSDESSSDGKGGVNKE
jgi:hypothetical protein